MFYAIPIARVFFTVKTSLDVFSLRCEHVSTCSDLGDCICEMKKVTGQHKGVYPQSDDSLRWGRR